MGEQTSLMTRLWARTGGVRNGIRELIFIGILYVGYTSSRLLASDDKAAALVRARQLQRIEQAVHLDWEHAVNTWFVHHDEIALLGCYFYSTAHYVVTLAALVWLYFKGRDAYLPARRALVMSTILALALYLMLPTAPPRFMGFTDVLALHADQGWWGADASAPKGMGDLTNQLAAFPSMHAGWSLWIALYVTRSTRNVILLALAWADAAITALVIVGTGNHWVLDVLVGWLVVIASSVAVAAFAPSTRTLLTPVPDVPDESPELIA